MEGGCHTAYTDNHYNNDLFSVICEEFYYSVLLTCLNMKQEIQANSIRPVRHLVLEYYRDLPLAVIMVITHLHLLIKSFDIVTGPFIS